MNFQHAQHCRATLPATVLETWPRGHGDLSHWSEEQLREEARQYHGEMYQEGDVGYCDPSHATWEFVADFPLAQLQHLGDDWKEWFEEECTNIELDGADPGWRAMLLEPIIAPIVVLMIDGNGYIWDGWHRTGASFVSGRTHIRAIVGTPCQFGFGD